jgi:hypothetical protein
MLAVLFQCRQRHGDPLLTMLGFLLIAYTETSVPASPSPPVNCMRPSMQTTFFQAEIPWSDALVTKVWPTMQSYQRLLHIWCWGAGGGRHGKAACQPSLPSPCRSGWETLRGRHSPSCPHTHTHTLSAPGNRRISDSFSQADAEVC